MGYLTPIEPPAAAAAVKLMSSVSVSFRSARAAVDDNETTCCGRVRILCGWESNRGSARE